MSLILDALNRSESDRRDPESVPGLQSVHGSRDEAPAAPWCRFLWPGLTLVFALLALGLWMFSQPAAEKTATSPADAGFTETVVSAQPEPAPEPAAVDPPAVPEPERAAAPADAPAAAASPSLSADVAALYEQQPAADPDPAPAAAPRAQATSEPAAPEPALDVEAITRAARAELVEGSARGEPVVEHSAPFIADLRQSQKDQIPSIFYSEHNWATNPAERSVVLNRQRFTEGQQVKPGLRLLEILPDSIVMEFQGTEFRLQSLNSWVNL
jgi:hypothetical protein